jgi:hypothetical protein
MTQAHGDIRSPKAFATSTASQQYLLTTPAPLVASFKNALVLRASRTFAAYEVLHHLVNSCFG